MLERRKKRKGNQKGVTLFEVMIALALFAVIIVPVMRAFVTSMKVNKRARETMIATDVAQSIMEGITGKTYYELWTYSFDKAPGGFDFSASARDTSGKYALSTLNDSYYNCGNETGKVLRFDGSSFSPSIGSITQTSFTNSDPNGMPLDKVMVKPACENLINVQMAGEGAVLNPNDNVWSNDKDASNDILTNDKRLYIGVSSQTYSDGTPILAYMLYTRIEKENQFFDATVTFVPTSQNDVDRANTSTGLDDFFTYEVTVSVYPYEYDPNIADWTGRFDGNGYIDGSPAAVMISGIQNK